MEKHVREEIDEETREKLCASVHLNGETGRDRLHNRAAYNFAVSYWWE